MHSNGNNQRKNRQSTIEPLWISTAEFAAMMGVAPNTLRKYMRKDIAIFPKPVPVSAPNRPRYHRIDVLNYLNGSNQAHISHSNNAATSAVMDLVP